MKLLSSIFPACFCLSSPKSSDKVSHHYTGVHTPQIRTHSNDLSKLVLIAKCLRGVFLCFTSKLNH